MVDIADPAPDFTLPLGDGGEIQLKALAGAPAVIFFISARRHARLHERGDRLYRPFA